MGKTGSYPWETHALKNFYGKSKACASKIQTTQNTTHMKYLIILILSIFSLFFKDPAPQIYFKGFIKDKETGLPIPNASVKINYQGLGYSFETATDLKGEFALKLVPGMCDVEYSVTQYQVVRSSMSFNPKNDTTVSAEILLKYLTSHRPDSVRNIIFNHSPGEPEKFKALEYDMKAPSSAGAPIVIPTMATAPEMHFTSPSSPPSFSVSGASRGFAALSLGSFAPSGERVSYVSGVTSTSINAGTLTAGEINDFSKWTLWNDLSKGELRSFVGYWGIKPKERFSVLVTNSSKSPMANVEVVLKNTLGEVVWTARTDNTGKAELWGQLFDSLQKTKMSYSLEAKYDGKNYPVKSSKTFSQGINKLVIPVECRQSPNMDVVFAVDATGSMGDEISYLQAELYDVIEKVKKTNAGMNIHMGSVFYRDTEDAYLTVQQDLTSDIVKVMDFIKAQSADGGGDEPEAVDAAMEVAIGKFSWRNDARARVMFLVLDASPHHEAQTLKTLKKYTRLAAAKGIRIVPIVCSGIDKAGEYLMRSIALATNGNYIFLTDHSGVGDSHMAPSVDKYSVETLNNLLIRLLQQYIFMPECNQSVNTLLIDSLQNNKSDSVNKDSSFLEINQAQKDSSNLLETRFLKYYPNPCRGILKVEAGGAVSEVFIADINGKLIMKVPLNPEQSVHEIDLRAFPNGVYFLRYCLDGKCKSGKFILMSD